MTIQRLKHKRIFVWNVEIVTSSGPTAFKQKAKENVCAVAMLLFHIPQTIYLKIIACFPQSCIISGLEITWRWYRTRITFHAFVMLLILEGKKYHIFGGIQWDNIRI
jgi:hypothetical protein